MGINGSVEADAPFNEHFYGLVNFGNTCYVNSVLQALYFCKPFREKIIQYKLQNNQKYLNASSTSVNSINEAAGTAATGNENGGGGLANGVSKESLKSSATAVSTATASNGAVSASAGGNKQENLLNCLAELFYSIVTMKKKKGIVQPKKFIARLRKDNDAFDNMNQQDAHEFLNYLLNTCADILKAEMKELRELQKAEEQNRLNESASVRLSTKLHRTLNKAGSANGATPNTLTAGNHSLATGNHHHHQDTPSLNQRNSSNNGSNRSINSQNSQSSKPASEQAQAEGGGGESKEELTWIHELFQGILVNETRCLNCDTSSSKEENFLDLSVDVEQNTSISHCLQEFSNMEMLCGECKYYCENCQSKQEAEKRMRIKKLPKILALHLKRFKYVGVQNKFKKLTYRVVFPFELRLFNTTEDCSNSDRIYDLVSFVVHCGMGLNRGHYISVVKSHGYWFLFDDETVEKIEVSSFEEFYGLTQDLNKKSETCYILFYESRQ